MVHFDWTVYISGIWKLFDVYKEWGANRQLILQMLHHVFRCEWLDVRNLPTFRFRFNSNSFYFFILNLVPNFVMGTIEIQFTAYLQLIRNRLKLLNTILVEFRPMKRNTIMNDFCSSIGLSCGIDSQRFLDGIGAYALNRKSKLHLITSNATASRSKNEKKTWHRTTVGALDWIVKLVVKPQILIAQFRGDAANLFSDSENVAKLQRAYTQLERTTILINSSYGIQLIVILIIRFTTLTSLLYFCCMMMIKWVLTIIITIICIRFARRQLTFRVYSCRQQSTFHTKFDYRWNESVIQLVWMGWIDRIGNICDLLFVFVNQKWSKTYRNEFASLCNGM